MQQQPAAIAQSGPHLVLSLGTNIPKRRSCAHVRSHACQGSNMFRGVKQAFSVLLGNGPSRTPEPPTPPRVPLRLPRAIAAERASGHDQD